MEFIPFARDEVTVELLTLPEGQQITAVVENGEYASQRVDEGEKEGERGREREKVREGLGGHFCY